MRRYDENWNYTITSTSLPYGLNNGSPSFAGGIARFPLNSFLNKDFAGYAFGFQGQNYSGDYALRFDIDLSNLDDEAYFVSLVYSKVTFVPALARRGTGVVLTWGTYTQFHNFYAGGDNYNIPGASQGDFNGQVVPGLTGTLILMRREDPVNASYTDSAAHFISEAGVHYFSGWLSAVDPYRHNQIGVSNQPNWVGGYASISTMQVADQLTALEMEAIRTTGAFPDDTPTPVITPGTGQVSGAVTVTMAMSSAPASWSIFYTTDGSAPTNASTPYTAPVLVPLSPGDVKTVKAIAYNPTTTAYSPVVDVTYTFVLAPPPAPTGGGGYGDLPLDFGNTPPAGVEYVYTQDGSDPTVPGNPSTRVWSPGTMILFGSWTPAQLYGNYALISVRAASRYQATGALSLEAPAQGGFYMGVDQLLGVHAPGNVSAAINMTLSCSSPRSRIFGYHGTQSEFGTVATTEISNPGAFMVPWSNTPATWTFYATDESQTLFGQPLTATWVFVVGAPKITPQPAISLVPVDLTITCESVGAVIRYTIDGSEPTLSSPLVTGPVSVAPGQTLKAISEINGAASVVASGSVLPEYEVKSVASAAFGQNRVHVYEAVQRLNLLTELGCSNNAVTPGANTSDTSVAVADDDGAMMQVYMYDTEGSFVDNLVAVNGALTALTCRPAQATRHWSRFCFSTSFNVDIAMTFNAALQAWLTEPKAPLILRALSRQAIVEVGFRVSGANLVCVGSVDHLGHAPNVTSTTTTSTPAGAHELHITGIGSSISFALDAATVFSATGLSMTSDWSIEIVTGVVGQVSANPLTSIPVMITTAAAEMALRRAPLALVGAMTVVDQSLPSTSTEVHTVNIDFNGPLDPVLFNFGSDASVSRIGYSQADGGLLLVGLGGFLEYNKYAIDTTKDFSVEVVADTYIKAYGTGTSSAGIRGPAHISLLLSDPIVSRNGYVVNSESNVYAQYTRVLSYSDNQAHVRDANGFQRVNFREVRQVKLRIAREGDAIHSYVYIDGIWIDLGAQVAPSTVQAHAYIKFTDDNQTPMSRFVVKSLSMTGVLTRNMMSAPAITGIEIKSKGVGVGFGGFDIPVLAPNSTTLLVMDRDTGSIATAPMQFEPSDTILVLGVIETDHLGVVAWTPLASSRSIRVRVEDDNGIGAGYILGAGSAPDVVDAQIHWLESGCPRAASLSGTTWHAPANQQHAWTRTRLIHGVDKHKISVSVVSGRN